MECFKWIDWNLDKIALHNLAPDEVESAFRESIGTHQERQDGSYETIGVTPSGRAILIVWRYDEIPDSLSTFGTSEVVFVITAF